VVFFFSAKSASRDSVKRSRAFDRLHSTEFIGMFACGLASKSTFRSALASLYPGVMGQSPASDHDCRTPSPRMSFKRLIWGSLKGRRLKPTSSTATLRRRTLEPPIAFVAPTSPRASDLLLRRPFQHLFKGFAAHIGDVSRPGTGE